MKVIQSYWSGEHVNEFYSNGKVGWREKKHSFMSLMLSCLLLKKYHHEVELMTDEAGAKLLLDTLKLPYSKVTIDLKVLHGYPRKLWVLSKIYCLGKQKSSFIYVEPDVFIREDLRKKLQDQTIFILNEQIISIPPSLYYYFLILKNQFKLGDLIKINQSNNSITSYNLGIVGGQNTNLFSNFSDFVFNIIIKHKDFIYSNIQLIPPNEIYFLNLLFEKYLFYQFISRYHNQVYAYSKPKIIDFHTPTDHAPSDNQFFFHPFFTQKKEPKAIGGIEYFLQSEFPVQYFHLISLLKQQKI